MKVLRYKDYDPKKVKYPCLVSIKMNGNWGRRYGASKGWFSRQAKPYHGLDAIDKSLEGIKTTLDGELLVFGVDFETSNGLIRNHSKVENPMFLIFDAPHINKPFKERIELLGNSRKLATLDHVHVIVHFNVNNEVELDQFYLASIAAGCEGIVICDPEAYYTHGRSYAKMKRCPVLRTEVLIISCYEGKGKMEGMLGGFHCELEDGTRVKVGGAQKGMWNYEERFRLWHSNDKFSGKQIRVTYKAKTKYGSLQQPKFEAFI